MKIGIIDIIGIPYDGTTVFKQGLGGSESAVTLASRELAALGFEVTVFNCCNLDHAQPGVYDQVTYRPLTDLQYDHDFDIVISSRTVIPFVDPKDFDKIKDNRCWPFKEYDLYNRILSRAQIRVLWMHDTFCTGDALIEELAVSDRITDIFTLSDFHQTYVSNCDHGRRRNFEVLKPKLFITRNGVRLYHDEVNIAAKDRNLFVFNASVTKGMTTLVEKAWPHIKRHIPEAKLKVIGGFYRFSKSSNPDAQEVKWHEMANDPNNAELDIEFTGVISQKEIADILVTANFMLYPSIFPETFGISSLESLCYNTPIVTCRFGALEEIAVNEACYIIDYAMEPNSLFPNINTAHQLEQFVKTTVEAYRNPYLHQQKQYYCNIVKDIAGWDSVALQWKQHFYKKSGRYLDRDEYRLVTKINHRIHKVFGRRFTNPVEMETHRVGNEQPITVVSTFYNCEKYIETCIKSIACQDYDNYEVYLVNDASTDNTLSVITQTLEKLNPSIAKKFKLIDNKTNVGAVCNQVGVFRQIANSDSIVMIIDGDDSLVNDNSIFAYYNAVYDGTTEFTYGSCWSMVDRIPLISQPYPRVVKQTKSYRSHHFNWILPYTHLRTFKSYLIEKIPDSNFQDENKKWFKAGGDGSVFYSLIEAADPNKVKCLTDIVYNYNDINPLNDYKVNAAEQNINAKKIAAKNNMTSQPKKKILIAVPTAKNIEVETFKSIYDLIVPDGYETTFQYFFGYNIDQVRNLIADWVVRGFDYLFSVDSDIAFAPDTLVKLLNHDVDMVSGLYIQRKPNEHTLEIYKKIPNGGTTNVPYEEIKGRGLVEIAGCGFGCVLIKKKVFQDIPYPHFVYHSAIDHRNTVSEDTDFCIKALQRGYKIFADTSILCKHIGSRYFLVEDSSSLLVEKPIQKRLRDLGNQRLLPKAHLDYLLSLNEKGIKPQVIYDIGSCVLHWTNEAQRIWPDAKYVVFEGMDAVEFLYKERNLDYNIGLLGAEDGREVDFYCNEYHPGGNSYYKENDTLNPGSAEYFGEFNRRRLKTVTLDTAVKYHGFPPPDFIKMDVQGAELDILKGAAETLKTVKYVILECQRVEYNKGAPLYQTVIDYMDSLGFDCQGLFCDNGPDGDYFFIRR